METLYTSLKAFLQEPFKTPISGWQYAALILLTIIIATLWTFVLEEVIRNVKEI